MCRDRTPGSGEDSPIPESECCTRDDGLAWVDSEDIYAIYKSLLELLPCEVRTVAFGRLRVSREDDSISALLDNAGWSAESFWVV